MSRFLNELDANKLLSSYGVPMAKSFVCKEAKEVEAVVKEIEFPIVMKILSADILHKTEAGCVFVGVKDVEEAIKTFDAIIKNAKAYKADAAIDGILLQEMAQKGAEVIIGMKKDPQFGPVIMVGSGGIYVEVFKDIALRLAPITRRDAEEMLAETKMNKIIQGARGVVYDKETLLDILLKVSKLVEENGAIEEIDINPLFLYEKGAKGVDALIKMA